jgi:phospholipase C
MLPQRRITNVLVVLLAGLLLTFVFVLLHAGKGQAVGQPDTRALNMPIPAFKHIFVIVLENKEYESVLQSAQAPYLNQLAQQYGLATNYYGITHPSLPNYISLISGDTQGITSNCTDCFVDAPTIVDQIEAAGKSWKGYMEAMPRPCFVGDDGALYRQKHNPFIYFDSIRNNPARCAKIVPFTDFAADAQANKLPNFVWITPNMCNDAHDCPLSSSDTWLRTWVPMILNSPAWKDQGVLFITFDEGTSNTGCCQEAAGGRIVTLVISPLVPAGFKSDVPYDHYGLLRTIEAAWGLPLLGKANCACSTPLAEFFPDVAANQRLGP